MKEKFLEEANLISKADQIENVSLSILRNSSAGIPLLTEFINGTMKKDALEIYDINGKPLFSDYTIKKGDEIIGTVRASASKIMGPPIISFEFGSRFWNYDKSVKELTLKFKKQFPTQKILNTKPVCYCYPKLGVMFEVINQRNKISSIIYDISDYNLVSSKLTEKNIEGINILSVYDALSEETREKNILRYNRIDKWRTSIPEKNRIELVKARSLFSVKDLKYFICKIKFSSIKQLQFCSHYNYNESRSHHSFSLHSQQKNDYCAVATCQMILCYYRYYFSQDTIAPSLGYHAGGCPSDQSAGYKSLSCNHLDASYETVPSWEKARDQINELHPLKSGIAGHARACAGYSYIWWLCDGIKDKKLFIYDPWPWNADYKLGGSVYWEDWDAVTHTNFVTTRIQCP